MVERDHGLREVAQRPRRGCPVGWDVAEEPANVWQLRRILGRLVYLERRLQEIPAEVRGIQRVSVYVSSLGPHPTVTGTSNPNLRSEKPSRGGHSGRGR